MCSREALGIGVWLAWRRDKMRNTAMQLRTSRCNHASLSLCSQTWRRAEQGHRDQRTGGDGQTERMMLLSLLLPALAALHRAPQVSQSSTGCLQLGGLALNRARLPRALCCLCCMQTSKQKRTRPKARPDQQAKAWPLPCLCCVPAPWLWKRCLWRKKWMLCSQCGVAGAGAVAMPRPCHCTGRF
jgi:hypothetical protein